MRMRKSHAFIFCLISIMLIFICLVLITMFKDKDKDISSIPVSASLTALVSITTAYMGIQMADNGVKGRNWNQQMYDSENKEEINERCLPDSGRN